MTKVTAKRNKKRGAETEREIARRLGGKRYPADTGGPVDVLVEPLGLLVQCKGGLRVLPEKWKRALDGARAVSSVGSIGALALEDRSGTRLRYFIVFELDDFAAREGVSYETGDEDNGEMPALPHPNG